MSTFLISNKNLKDLTDLEEARHNLGLGSIATQDSDDVRITGGNIEVDTIRITSSADMSGQYAMADSDGTIIFSNLNVPEWVQVGSGEIGLLQFVNDADFVTSDQLKPVCFTGSYDDLEGIPDLSIWENLARTFVDDTTFLVDSNNLSELSDRYKEVGENLGLGSMAYQNDYYVTVSNLTIHDEFRFNRTSADFSGTHDMLYLGVDSTNCALWKPLPVADTQTLGVIRLSDDYLNYPSPTSLPTAASTVAVHEAYKRLSERLNILDDADANIVNLIEQYGIISISSNIMDVSPAIVDDLRELLQLGTLSIQNADNVEITDLKIGGRFRYFPPEGTHTGFLMTDQGVVSIVSAEELKATASEPGLVRVSNSIQVEQDNVIPSAMVVNQRIENLHDEITRASSVIDETIIESLVLRDTSLYLLTSFDNLEKELAIEKLGLPRVAITGNYNDLVGKVSSVDELSGSDSLLRIGNNLSELNPNQAHVSRANLGLGTMSEQNDDNVNIVNGVANFRTVNVTDTFRYTHRVNYTNDHEPLFLRCINTSGHAEWGVLPIATEQTAGVVKFANDIGDIDGSTAISGFGFAKAYVDMVTRLQNILTLLEANDTQGVDTIAEEIVAVQTDLKEALFKYTPSY